MTDWLSLGARLAVLGIGASVIACIELSGPEDDLSAISPIAIAWPSVVVGDVLRDIAGVEAPLHLDAYDGDGNVVSDATVNFIVLDPGVSVDTRGVVRGVTEGATSVRIVAQVRRGKAVLQTPEAKVDVVQRPDSVSPANDTTYRETIVPAIQATPITLDTIKVSVVSRGSGQVKGVKSWLVRFEILDVPAGVNGRRTTQYGDGGTPNERVSIDTTDGSGNASRAIVLQSVALERPNSSEPTRHDVRVLVTVGNTRPGGRPTMFFVTLPINVE